MLFLKLKKNLNKNLQSENQETISKVEEPKISIDKKKEPVEKVEKVVKKDIKKDDKKVKVKREKVKKEKEVDLSFDNVLKSKNKIMLDTDSDSD